MVCVISPGLLFRALRARQGLQAEGQAWILDQAFPAARATPRVTVLDGHPHTLAFLARIDRLPHAAAQPPLAAALAPAPFCGRT